MHLSPRFLLTFDIQAWLDAHCGGLEPAPIWDQQHLIACKNGKLYRVRTWSGADHKNPTIVDVEEIVPQD